MIVSRLVEHSGQLLVVTIADQPVEPREKHSAELARFAAHIGAPSEGQTTRAADALEKAFTSLEVDLRRCEVDRAPFQPSLPNLRSCSGRFAGVGQLSLNLPQIHRRNDGGFRAEP